MMLFPVNAAVVAAIVSPTVIGWAIIAALVVILLAAGYCKAPPDKAYIISGLRKRVLIGRAGFRIPF